MREFQLLRDATPITAKNDFESLTLTANGRAILYNSRYKTRVRTGKEVRALTLWLPHVIKP